MAEVQFQLGFSCLQIPILLTPQIVILNTSNYRILSFNHIGYLDPKK